MSALGPMACWVEACSGAMYPGVPSTMALPVSACEAAIWRARPKSSSTTSSTFPLLRKRLEGLMSRWMIPWACAVASPSATRRTSSSASERLKG
jgi:hypothetical protein